MTPIPPIPEQDPALENLLRWNQEKAERIAKLTAEVEDVEEYLPAAVGPYQTLAERAKLLKDQMEFATEQVGLLCDAKHALEAENTRLKAPLSDVELTPHCLGTKYFLTEVFDKVIASRATRTTPQEGQ